MWTASGDRICSAGFRQKVLTLVMMTYFLSYIIRRLLLRSYRLLGGNFCVHFQGKKISKAWPIDLALCGIKLKKISVPFRSAKLPSYACRYWSSVLSNQSLMTIPCGGKWESQPPICRDAIPTAPWRILWQVCSRSACTSHVTSGYFIE
jgi:hypothetical protein